MRHRGKVDANQPEIVRALRQAGCSVLSISNMGKGCPDLLVGIRGQNFLMEIKDPSRKPSEQLLTDDEETFHMAWTGQVAVIKTIEQALAVVGCT
jgi:Holliday junction resolvase